MKNRLIALATLIAISGAAQAAMVTIGNAGNAADTTGYGAVGYTYQISTTEVTIAEFMASGAGSGNENFWNAGARTVGTAAPATYVSLYEAMKYCNYLTSGDVTLGAYQFSGGVYQSTDRASAVTAYGTVYALPTEDEWYKAAYFKPNASGYSLYANGTGTTPTQGGGATGWNYNSVNVSPNYARDVALGTMEQNGTYNMMGNVWEWTEDSFGVIRGGGMFDSESALRSSDRYVGGPTDEDFGIGFRVVAIPEPASAMLVFFGAGIGLAVHRARRAATRR